LINYWAPYNELKTNEDIIISKMLAGFTENELEQLNLALKKMRENMV
jgi:DNA-binding MarR family transcriptional regulator